MSAKMSLRKWPSRFAEKVEVKKVEMMLEEAMEEKVVVVRI